MISSFKRFQFTFKKTFSLFKNWLVVLILIIKKKVKSVFDQNNNVLDSNQSIRANDEFLEVLKSNNELLKAQNDDLKTKLKKLQDSFNKGTV